MTPITAAALALAGTLAAATPAAARCLEGPYAAGAVAKHPMTPMHTAKPRNPLEEPLVRCSAAAARERAERTGYAERLAVGRRDRTALED